MRALECLHFGQECLHNLVYRERERVDALPPPGGSLPTLASVSNISIAWEPTNEITKNIEPSAAVCPAVRKDEEALEKSPEGRKAFADYQEEIAKIVARDIGADKMQGRRMPCKYSCGPGCRTVVPS